MPSAWRLLEDEMTTYLRELEEDNRSPVTLRKYRWTLTTLFQALMDDKRTINPRKVRREDVRWLIDDYLTGKESYKSSQVKRLLIFLRWAGNTDATKMRLPFGCDESSTIRWLSDEEAMIVRTNSKGIVRMIVHCELDLCMRRIELLRLKVGDFYQQKNDSQIHVHGKGRNGGKHRRISWDVDTARILSAYLTNYRDAVIAKARAKDSDVKIPDNLFLYERGGSLHAYKESAIDYLVKDYGHSLGIEMSNHDLRRTGGRLLHRAGVPIEEIARIFGHRDTKTTLHYLGLDRDDMNKAMKKVAEYRNTLVCPKTGIFDTVPVRECGGTGI